MTHTPYGYKIINGQAVIDEPVAAKIRLLYKEYLNFGSMTAAAVKAGIDKTHSVIGRILKNKMYLGDEYYPQLIDAETFEQVQTLRYNNAKRLNRIREYEPEERSKDNTTYRIGKVPTKFDNPYKQAEYAYGLIEEDINE